MITTSSSISVNPRLMTVMLHGWPWHSQEHVATLLHAVSTRFHALGDHGRDRADQSHCAPGLLRRPGLDRRPRSLNVATRTTSKAPSAVRTLLTDALSERSASPRAQATQASTSKMAAYRSFPRAEPRRSTRTTIGGSPSYPMRVAFSFVATPLGTHQPTQVAFRVPDVTRWDDPGRHPRRIGTQWRSDMD